MLINSNQIVNYLSDLKRKQKNKKQQQIVKFQITLDEMQSRNVLIKTAERYNNILKFPTAKKQDLINFYKHIRSDEPHNICLLDSGNTVYEVRNAPFFYLFACLLQIKIIT
ncbi:hypothetical protein TTHERM_000935423 (macronuclear) [Tetrahymena thermophila SB210]|uniref:Uncharacterized protein n=1 Tax=Tetrahymena thermophila (strain SB210) TaxID=312017 RepID=W7XIJ0_TETTS|nr:hypothetical protein TTHERM_000935423 [Tetrahymena thermophila SB210]EWS73324.1 hypothetical protein TTHERM_000935423 [Tetrahymena thermophila SB210]|eukprot:XP_012654129.1 hypothetical protein TTHERM_000935423 [Tetrahymena thermophila SB210]